MRRHPEPAGSAVAGLCALVWAKSSPYKGLPEHWLDLPQHLDDTADVAGLLWDEWLADDLRALISEPLPAGQDDARRLVRFLAGVHDVGKASPAFASKVPTLSNRMHGAGLRMTAATIQDRSRLRHEVAGAAALERWLSAYTPLPPAARRRLSVVVAGHHGGYAPYSEVQDAPDRDHLFGDGPWLQVQDALIARAAGRADVLSRWDDWRDVRLSASVQMLLTAVLVVADWVASDERWFPLRPIDVVAVPEEPVSTESDRARRGWARLRFSPRWTAPAVTTDVDLLFPDRFPQIRGRPHAMQSGVVKLARTMPAPGLLLVEAPMGSGKTEAALLAAETLARRTGASGVFVALPTQATSDAMFSRVASWLRHIPTDSTVHHSLSLVHGKAALNDDFTGLPMLRARAVYDELDESDQRRQIVPVADVWARGRKRAAFASFVVGTIDQVLFGALLARHLMLRQLSLAGKVVIIDEVHAADTFMSTFLDRTLEWLGAAGTPVVLLSATLPSARRGELCMAYERGRRRRLSIAAPDVETSRLQGDIGYPVAIATGDDQPQVVTFGGPTTHSQVLVHRLDDDLDMLVALLDETLRDGGCAAVIRNTVGRAQETARHLESHFGTDVVTVAHARFLAADRRENDIRLLAELGRDGVRPPRRIVVGTQVLEQSLDVDFDVIVTDLAPVDLVLQRIGRLHRHRRDGRPYLLREPRCYVAGTDWSSTIPQPVRGSVRVYGRYPLLAAAAVLAPHLTGKPVLLPRDIARLVQTAYAPGAPAPAGWEQTWADAARKDADEQERRRSRASVFLLPDPSLRDLYGVMRGGLGDIDEDSPQGQACVREGGDSIEVVVVQHGLDGTDRIPDWIAEGRSLPFRHVPVDDEDARLLARCTVRLPPSMSLDPRMADKVIRALEQDRFEGWDASPVLKGQLALVLDDDARAQVAGFGLHYDRRYGLTAAPVGAPP